MPPVIKVQGSGFRVQRLGKNRYYILLILVLNKHNIVKQEDDYIIAALQL
jgi:hypothetical protein